MSVDFKTFNTIAPLVANSRLPILLRGRHGIGKSQVVYQLATSLDRAVVERRASQMTEGDLVGLPDVDNTARIGGHKSTSFCPPDWFLMAVAEPVVLFFDEVDRAVPEVRQGLFELMDSRKLNGVTIHPDTVVVAAINGGEHGSQYQVHEMDPAELDRYTVFDVEPTVEDWLAWGKDNVADPIWDFINNNRSHLEHTGDFEPNKVYPSRRSWDRLNSTADAAGLLEPEANLDNLFTLATAFVGFEAAVSLRDFVANYTKVVTPEMIIDDGNIECAGNVITITVRSGKADAGQCDGIFYVIAGMRDGLVKRDVIVIGDRAIAVIHLRADPYADNFAGVPSRSTDQLTAF